MNDSTWIIASKIMGQPIYRIGAYPCLCGWRDGRQTYRVCNKWCPCAGREERESVPATCCGRRAYVRG